MSFNKSEKSFFEEEREKLEKLEKKGTKKALKLYDFGASSLRAEIKRRPAQYFFLFISTFLGSVITSSIALFGFSTNILTQFTGSKLPEKVVAVQTVSPTPKVVTTEKYDHQLLASKLRKGDSDLVIIDIRGEKEYKAGHIVTSKNLPVYGSSDMVTEDGDLNAPVVKEAFSEYLSDDKTLVIYAQNAYSTLPTAIASLFQEDGLKVKALAVGFEEWEFLQKKK